MAQFLQQVPWAPILHGFMVAARSKTVSIPSSWARTIISWVAGHIDTAVASANFLGLTVWVVFISDIKILLFRAL
jgi:hypothetical protein